MSLRGGLAVLVALGALLASAAVAQVDPPGPRTVSGIDAAGDVKGRLDLRRVTLARLKGDRSLRGELRMRRTWGTADLRSTSGADGSLCLRLFTRNDPDSEAPNFLVCARPAPDSEKLIGSVLRERNGGPPAKVADARVTRRDGRAVRLRFPRKALPRKLLGVRFGGESVNHMRGCRPPLGCRDLAPDAPDTLYLDLRRAG